MHRLIFNKTRRGPFTIHDPVGERILQPVIIVQPQQRKFETVSFDLYHTNNLTII